MKKFSVKPKSIKASWDPTDADLYVVKIWHEVECNAEDCYGPEAAEEIFEIVARSPQDAKEQAIRQWDGPVDRIEIVDVNPEDYDYNAGLPFEASTNINSSFKCSSSEYIKGEEDEWDDEEDEGDDEEDEGDDEEDDMTYMDACDEKNFYQIEDEVCAELGLYLDFSSVRGDYGTVFVYSDPNHENNADIWMGDDDAEITRIDYPDYAYAVEMDVLTAPESEWKERYKKYLENEIN